MEERLQILGHAFNNSRNANIERQSQMAENFANLRAWVLQDLCTVREHLERLEAPRRSVDPSVVGESRQNFYEWILQREYLNQVEYIRDSVDAVIVGNDNQIAEEQKKQTLNVELLVESQKE